MATMWAEIPYTTFPVIELGPLSLRTFGLCVGLGVLLGIAIAARWGERAGVPADDTISLGTRMVLAGVVGARVTWVLTHPGEIDSPLDLVAVWQGGLQFSGGFLAAVAVGLPSIRRRDRLQRWRLLDGMALGLTVGLAIGRVGCYAVGEHLGGPTSFPFASRYDGGSTREGPLVVSQAIHNTALYELAHLVVLAGLLWWLLSRPRSRAGTGVGVFLVWYGVGRFLTDFLRTYDDTVLGLTGAQWMCLGLLATAVWVWAFVRPSLARLSQDREPPGRGSGAATGGDDAAALVSGADGDVSPDSGAPPVSPAAS